MARRVNTRFVMLLGSGLLLAVVVVGSYGVWRYLRNRDPVHLAKVAEAAEARAAKYKVGDAENIDALKQAADYYNMAAIASSKKHREGTEQLYMKVADLEMRLSALVGNPTEAQGYYGAAQSAWRGRSRKIRGLCRRARSLSKSSTRTPEGRRRRGTCWRTRRKI